ncbi:MAG TPA: hypothetical protein VGR56_06310 [Nitrososphaerales archaeon]|nr:hypothetical protein [Nitrososphaerales archaeon]
MNAEEFEQTIPARALVPFIGYPLFISLTVEFFGAFGAEVTVKRSTVLENTALYFFLGAFTVLITHVLPLFRPLFPLLPEIVIAGCLAAAVFEVDFMVRHPDAKFLGIDLRWQNWKLVPRRVAQTAGRKLVALGMYHAIIFLLLGIALAIIVFV